MKKWVDGAESKWSFATWSFTRCERSNFYFTQDHRCSTIILLNYCILNLLRVNATEYYPPLMMFSESLTINHCCVRITCSPSFTFHFKISPSQTDKSTLLTLNFDLSRELSRFSTTSRYWARVLSGESKRRISLLCIFLRCTLNSKLRSEQGPCQWISAP